MTDRDIEKFNMGMNSYIKKTKKNKPKIKISQSLTFINLIKMTT
jgi:hypothetical protein